MNAFVAVLSVFAATAVSGQVVSIEPAGYGATTVVRAPAHDSASIESHRLGGNFAYSTAEAHAFAATTQVLSKATHVAAVTTNTHVPAPIAHVQPAPIQKTNYAAQPIIGQKPIIAQQPIIGQVAQHTRVHQPVFKSQRIVQTSPAVAYQAGPAVATPIGAAYAPAYGAAYGAGYAAAGPIAAGPALAYNGAINGAYNGVLNAGAYNGLALNGAYANGAYAPLAAAPLAQY